MRESFLLVFRRGCAGRVVGREIRVVRGRAGVSGVASCPSEEAAWASLEKSALKHDRFAGLLRGARMSFILFF